MVMLAQNLRIRNRRNLLPQFGNVAAHPRMLGDFIVVDLYLFLAILDPFHAVADTLLVESVEWVERVFD